MRVPNRQATAIASRSCEQRIWLRAACRWVGFGWMLPLLVACGVSSDAEPAECTYSYQCPLGSECQGGSCVRETENIPQDDDDTPIAVECLSNVDCLAFEGVCAPEGVCVDCLLNQHCQGPTAQCIERTCFGESEDPNTPCIGEECERFMLGDACAQQAQCSDGLSCLRFESGTFCSRACIGNGLNEATDCPLGYACQTTSHPGLPVCAKSEWFIQPPLGAPYDRSPGAHCVAQDPEQRACQTGVCSQGQCVRQCRSDRDCDADEQCRVPAGNPMNVLRCLPAIPAIVGLGRDGEPCGEPAQCERSICQGFCRFADTPCNRHADCTVSGDQCDGFCRRPCADGADCQANQSCRTQDVAVRIVNNQPQRFDPLSICIDGHTTGALPLGSSCTTDATCQSGRCIAGQCSQSCRPELNQVCESETETMHCEVRVTDIEVYEAICTSSD